jgi:hypothetical protein
VRGGRYNVSEVKETVRKNGNDHENEVSRLWYFIGVAGALLMKPNLFCFYVSK